MSDISDSEPDGPSGTGAVTSAHRVGVIGGDGIGPEVLAEALKVVAAAGIELQTTDYELGADHYLSSGEVLPDETLERLRAHFAADGERLAALTGRRPPWQSY